MLYVHQFLSKQVECLPLLFIYCLISIVPLHYRPVRPIYDVEDDESEREYDEERGVDGGDPLAMRKMVRQD